MSRLLSATPLSRGVAVLLFTLWAHQAQALITYVDATEGPSGNTTLLDGTEWNAQQANSIGALDNEWQLRGFANNGTVYGASVVSGWSTGDPTENAHMLRTTITGLTPGTPYDIYGYFWSGSDWRLEGTIDPANINDNGTPGNILDDFLPEDPAYTFTRLAGIPNTTQAFPSDANRFNDEVMVVDDTRLMYQAPFGMTTADNNGEIHVYIDDWENDANQRTWYDGVGYEEVGVPTLTIDRATGEMVYTSLTPRDILGYSIKSPAGTLTQDGWTTITDAYDATATGDNVGLVDADDSWSVLSEASSTTDLSEAELNLSGTRDGGTLPADVAISFGTAWELYFVEDVTMDLLLNDGQGTVEPVKVEFVGNGGLAFAEGDLNFDGSVGPEDYSIFLASLFSPISGSMAEAYASGDFNQDIAVDFDDLQAFREVYDIANGAGAFQAMVTGVAVPEPTSGFVFISAILGCLALRCRRIPLALLAICLTVASSSALAKITYVDAVPNDVDGAVNMGVNTTRYDGSAWSATAANAADGLYRFRESGSWGNNGIYETNAAGPEDSPILITTVEGLNPDEQYFTYGFFWSNPSQNWRLKITHDPSYIDDNGTPGDLLDDFIVNEPIASFSAAGSPTSTQGPQIDASAFEGTVVVGSNPAMYAAELGLHSPNANGELIFYVDDLENQSSGPTRTWFDGVGYEELIDLTLEVNSVTGNARILNDSGSSVDLSYYKITSSNLELNPAGWSTLDMQNLGAVDGDDPGTDAGDSELEGWDMAGGSGSGLLAEVNFLGSTPLGSQSLYTLGQAFMPGVTSGVTFEYESNQGLITGNVVFVDEVDLPGDYDNNGTVEMDDYLTWKADFGQTGLDLDSDGSGDGVVDIADYVVWRNNLGASLPPGAVAAASVPEPATWLAAVMCLAAVCLKRVRLQRVPALLSLATLLGAGLFTADRAAADYTLDRQYLMGDDSLEGGSPGTVVGTMNTGALAAGNSADTFGPVSGSFLDVTVGGTPEYVDVDTIGGGRPLTSVANSHGIVFDGTGDYLDGVPLNRPDELALILATSTNPTTYPINYDGIMGRGMQMWVYPDQAGIDAGGFQSIVSDSIYAGGPAIDENGNWSQMNSRHFANITTGPEAMVPVVGDTWYHVMQHIYLDGTPGAPKVIAGGAPYEFTSVMYVDGIAVSANNDTQTFTREYQDGPPLVVVNNSQPDYDHRLVIGGSELPNSDTDGPTLYGNFFDGVIDDLEMYVYGNNEMGTPGDRTDGEDWGTFDLFSDNAWIANEIATNPSLAGTLENGDLDLDGDIDADDISAFIDGWLSRKVFEGAHRTATVGDWETWTWGDMDHDGEVYLTDLYLMHEALQGTAFGGFNVGWLDGAPIQVPEPATCVLLSVGILAIGGARMRRKNR
ncbi:hypothetical protein NG895_29065 [Aeoliella sp. ICT_H6.2]|uniref:PEP-CTERM protein-sorting domain-containing protein n=1 Tax=Aeoliella straminimaris TaxID=2954799 RepID=A0A9X2FF23_9BACT|nr:hypothetical protein [Aeoliella straminimaris]MCO6047972.1 hypothetical protein [Aeoliella straminimaris]